MNIKTMVPVFERHYSPGRRPKSLHDVLDEVCHEVKRAEGKHAPMHSAHEGYAVILEELDELKAEIWKGGRVPRDPVAMRKEAVEVAAMAVRFIRDVCDGRTTTPPRRLTEIEHGEK